MTAYLARFFLLFSLCMTAHAQVFDVPHESEAPTRTLLKPAPNPVAIVLLFPGRSGMLRLQDDGSTRNKHTFVRSVDEWSQYGISAVLVDSPVDLGNSRHNLRFGSDHQKRIWNVVRFYREKSGLPIWLMGHSMGTTSVVAFANHGEDWRAMIAGIAVAGTHVTARLNKEVKLPTIAIHHRLDGCKHDPVSASKDIVADRPANTRSQFVLIDGGEDSGEPCGSMAYHGFNQREEQLVAAAARFMTQP